MNSRPINSTCHVPHVCIINLGARPENGLLETCEGLRCSKELVCQTFISAHKHHGGPIEIVTIRVYFVARGLTLTATIAFSTWNNTRQQKLGSTTGAQ